MINRTRIGDLQEERLVRFLETWPFKNHNSIRPLSGAQTPRAQSEIDYAQLLNLVSASWAWRNLTPAASPLAAH